MREETPIKSEAPGLGTKARAGKVRDVYDDTNGTIEDPEVDGAPELKQKLLANIDSETLILLATDRISAFDMVLPTPIPGKGKVLTAMSAFWFKKTEKVVPNHLIYTTDDEWFAENAPEIAEQQGIPIEDLEFLRNSAMIVRKAERLPVECIVRGYMAGSAWVEYQEQRTVCGVRMPAGIQESEQFPEPLFTPTTKAEVGHDENLSAEEYVDLIGMKAANALKVRSLALYKYGAGVARERGIIIADTKFEFGLINGEETVIDEILTPDSSRFWDAETYEPGRHQEALDKQYVRDWLLESGWDRKPPPPELPPDVVAETSRRYSEIYQRLTGKTLPG